jgi:hypothetical protein
VFDRDYTPEGVGLQLTHNLSDKHALKLIGGAFIIDESRTIKNDPFYYGAQLRLDSTWSPKLSSSLGIAALAINARNNITYAAGSGIPRINTGNTRTPGGWAYGYNPIIADASVTYALESFPFYTGAFPITLAGEYMNNPLAKGDNYAWSAGITFGKAGKRGLWDVGYRYKYLGADAWFEQLVDSDFGAFYAANPANMNGLGAGYAAGTNVRGHIMKLQYSPFNSTTIAVTYFMTDLINSHASPLAASSKSDAGRLQVDINWKF